MSPSHADIFRAILATIVVCGAAAACTVKDEPDGSGPGAGAGVGPGGENSVDAIAVPLTDRERKSLESLSPATLPPPPADVTNAHADDAAAAAFGQKLFFDASLSGQLLHAANDGGKGTLGKVGDTGKVSCASCHDPASGFADARSPGGALSLGAQWTRRRAPSLLDIGQPSLYGWDGRHDALYKMSAAVMESPAAMNSSRTFVAQQVFLHHRADYEAIFGPMPPLDDARFVQLTPSKNGCQSATSLSPDACDDPPRGAPGDPAYDRLVAADQDAISHVFTNLGKALAAYQRLLTCGPSRFDAWIHGQANALNASEQRGAKLFVGRGGCITCHSGPFLSNEKFHNVGLMPAPRPDHGHLVDNGAFTGITQAKGDPLGAASRFSDGDNSMLPETVTENLRGAFRTPRLRCVSKRPSFMHDGSLASLAAVVAFFDRGGDASGYLGVKEIAPIGLSPQESSDLVAFLDALDGPGPAPALRTPPP